MAEEAECSKPTISNMRENLTVIMDPFQRLPAEIIRSIIQYTPDFIGLESLFLVSAQVKAVFQADPCVVLLDDLIASTTLTAMPDIQKTFRQVALLHNQSACCGSIDDYIHLTCENLVMPTSCYMSSSALLQMVRTAAQLQRLACACLFTMQRNFCTAVETYSASSHTFTGQVPNLETPPSWTEEYRVYRALWHLRHYSDLQKVAHGHTTSVGSTQKLGGWDWFSKSIDRLDPYASWNDLVNSNGLLDCRIEEIWSVAAILADLGLQASYGSVGQGQEEPSQARWDLPPETPMPLFTSFELPHHAIDYSVWGSPPVPEDAEAYTASQRSSKSPTIWFPPLEPDDPEADKAGHRSSNFLHKPTIQSVMFRLISKLRLQSRPIVTGLQDVRPYRRLGVFMWDKWRIYSAGLMDRSSTRDSPTPSGGFWELQSRWLALIGKET